jgi:NTP pyrophosphatase (non-canonical NTP hydrolase)
MSENNSNDNGKYPIQMDQVRTCVMYLLAELGELAILEVESCGSYFLTEMTFVNKLFELANLLRIDIVESIKAKMIINKRKYPIDACHGKIDKYTAYSKSTHITKHAGQSLTAISGKKIFLGDKQNTISGYNEASAGIYLEILTFSKDRDWDKFDTKRNLLLAIATEVGELCELFQWEEDKAKTIDSMGKKWDKAASEIADIFIYMVKLQRQFLPIAIEDVQDVFDAENKEDKQIIPDITISGEQ